MQARNHNFQPRCVTVADYVSKVKSGQYDINPEFQREGYKPTKWKQAVIAHHCQFGTVPTLYYHHNFDKNCKENLDGKQRTIAFMDYMDNKFPIPKLPGVPEDMCCRYNELSPKNKMLFDDSVIIITVTDSQLSPDEIKTFFKNVQKSSDTSPGEKLNANTSNFVVKFVKQKLPSDQDILERINICDDNRKGYLSFIMRHMFLKIVPNGLVRKYDPETSSIDKWSSEFSEDDIETLEEAYQSVLMTAEFLHTHNVKNAHLKYVFGSFFRFLNHESSMNISKLIQKIGETTDGDVFEDYSIVCSGDTHATSYDRYKYLVNVFIK